MLFHPSLLYPHCTPQCSITGIIVVYIMHGLRDLHFVTTCTTHIHCVYIILRYTLLDKDMKEVVTCSQSASCGLTLAMAKRLQPFKTKFAACNKKIHKESDCVVIVKSLLLSMKVITTPPLGHGQSDEHPPHGHERSHRRLQ